MIGRRGFLAALLVGPCVPTKPAGVDYKPPATGEQLVGAPPSHIGFACTFGRMLDDGRWLATYRRSPNRTWTDEAMPWAGMTPQQFRFKSYDEMEILWA